MVKAAESEITIQPFENGKSKDVMEFIVEIQRTEFGISISASDQPDLMSISSFYQNNNGNFWVATCENRIVGTISLLDIGGRMGALRKMFVGARFRGKKAGVAQKLLQTLISWSNEHEIEKIYLGTTPKFLAAHRFYEKNGFKEIMKEDLPTTFPIMKVDTKFYQLEIQSLNQEEKCRLST